MKHWVQSALTLSLWGEPCGIWAERGQSVWKTCCFLWTEQVLNQGNEWGVLESRGEYWSWPWVKSSRPWESGKPFASQPAPAHCKVEMRCLDGQGSKAAVKAPSNGKCSIRAPWPPLPNWVVVVVISSFQWGWPGQIPEMHVQLNQRTTLQDSFSDQ